MSQTYIERSLQPVVEKAAKEFPVVVLVGPRQSGKTTLLNHLFADKYTLVSLESPDVRLAAANDPRGFLDLYRPPIIFDEIQSVPLLLPYIKERIDESREITGQYILTGSQNLLLMQQVTESLAGRAAILKLLPLSFSEANLDSQRLFPWETDVKSVSANPSDPDLWMKILRGFYPEVVSHPDRDARLWQSGYEQTYLERDVRALKNIGDLNLFQTFLHALATRSAQILNLSDLAKDVAISVNTARAWLSILESSFQIFLLKPYSASIGKRLIKSPKVYFTDTGLLCYLVGLRDAEHAASGPMGGAIFENLVVAEIYKRFIHRGEEPPLYFWRTSTGSEVDLIVEDQQQLIPIEIKQSQTIRPEMARGISVFQSDFPLQVSQSYILHPGGISLPMGKNIFSLPLSNL